MSDYCAICEKTTGEKNLCLWTQFKGEKLCDYVSEVYYHIDDDDIKKTNTADEYVKLHNRGVERSTNRMIELWKEYYGKKLKLASMKKWEEFVEHTPFLMNNTPMCIPYHIKNMMPPMEVVDNDKIALALQEWDWDEEAKRLGFRKVLKGIEHFRDYMHENKIHNAAKYALKKGVTKDLCDCSGSPDMDLDDHPGIMAIRNEWN